MPASWNKPSAANHLAEYLRGELVRGRWRERMPGVIRLAGELGAARNTVEAALRELDQQGILIPQGYGKGRRIHQAEVAGARRMRVAILRQDPLNQMDRHIGELLYQLHEAGFVGVLAAKNLTEMRGNLKKMERLVTATRADAWVIVGGAMPVLEWFIARELPAFSLFGRRHDLPIAGAGPSKPDAYRAVARRLVGLGHQRVMMITLKSRRLPSPGLQERVFLEELQSLGVKTGNFNLPDWDETPEGLENLLQESFRVTPPTALLVDEAYLFHAVKHHLAARGIHCPQQVSLVCSDPDQSFVFCRPSIAHIHWDRTKLVQKVVRWVANIRHGKPNIRQSEIPAEFVDGDTVAARPEKPK
ncbi:MAG: substrate-binding domain-containing protein [Luteolibacter sp.]